MYVHCVYICEVSYMFSFNLMQDRDVLRVFVDDVRVLEVPNIGRWRENPYGMLRVFEVRLPRGSNVDRFLRRHNLPSVMSAYLYRVESPFIHSFAGKYIFFDGALIFSVPELGILVLLCYGVRRKYGRDRRYVAVAFHRYRDLIDGIKRRQGYTNIVVEFKGTDNYETERTLVAMLKKPRSNKLYLPSEEPINELKPFVAPKPHVSYIRAARSPYSLAVLVRLSETKQILRYALTRMIVDEYIK